MTQASSWVAAGAALTLVIVAGIADWRRTHRRRAIDNVGWVPWRGIQATAFFVALAFVIVAVKA